MPVRRCLTERKLLATVLGKRGWWLAPEEAVTKRLVGHAESEQRDVAATRTESARRRTEANKAPNVDRAARQ